MATAEEANEFLGSLASIIDDQLSGVGPTMTFALVIWKKGSPSDEKSVAVLGHPDFRNETPVALETASKWAGWKP